MQFLAVLLLQRYLCLYIGLRLICYDNSINLLSKSLTRSSPVRLNSTTHTWPSNLSTYQQLLYALSTDLSSYSATCVSSNFVNQTMSKKSAYYDSSVAAAANYNRLFRLFLLEFQIQLLLQYLLSYRIILQHYSVMALIKKTLAVLSPLSLTGNPLSIGLSSYSTTINNGIPQKAIWVLAPLSLHSTTNQFSISLSSSGKAIGCASSSASGQVSLLGGLVSSTDHPVLL